MTAQQIEPDLPRAERLRRELRAEIVRTAADEFAASGYHRAGIADIARRLGIGHSSIYAHFPSKRAILDAVIEDTMGRVYALLTAENAPAAADTMEAYRDQARRIAQSFSAVVLADPGIMGLLRMLLVEGGGVDEELAGKADAFLDAAAAITATYLQHGKDRGYLRADLDVAATAKVVNAMIISIGLEQTRRDATPEETGRLVDAALALYVSGVGAG